MEQRIAKSAPPEKPDPGRNAVRQLMRSASVEVTPGELRNLDALAQLLPAQTRVYITSITGKPLAASVDAARLVREAGMVPVPHLAARKIADLAELSVALERLRTIGVKEALVIAGDIAEPVGTFRSAIDLLSTGAFREFDFKRIGIAGYPEGHPKIPEKVLSRSLADKAELAKAGYAEFYIVTQFCFDAASIIAWERRIRPLTRSMPVHIGVTGLISVRRLLRYAAICGIGASAQFLRQNAAGIGWLVTAWTPERLVRAVAGSVAADPDSAITQFHFFPFGALGATAEWVRSMQAETAEE